MKQQNGQTKVRRESKGTMTDISLMKKPKRVSQLKPTGAPRRSDFALQDRERQANLGDQDKRLARQIWRDHVEPLKEEFVPHVFNHFFLANPHLSDLFLRMDSIGLPRLTLPESTARFKSVHMARIWVRLGDMMNNIDNPRKLTKIMTQMGVAQARMGIDNMGKLPVLSDFQKAIMSTVKMIMDGRMLAVEEVALSKCLDLAFSIMQEASFTYYDMFIASAPAPGRKSRNRASTRLHTRN